MVKTTLYLPEELQRALRAASRRAGKPQAELVREALERYLRAQRRPRVRSVGMGTDEEVTGRTSEAWLEAERRR